MYSKTQFYLQGSKPQTVGRSEVEILGLGVRALPCFFGFGVGGCRCVGGLGDWVFCGVGCRLQREGPLPCESGSNLPKPCALAFRV